MKIVKFEYAVRKDLLFRAKLFKAMVSGALLLVFFLIGGIVSGIVRQLDEDFPKSNCSSDCI